jgi:hypothetical protein
MKTRSNSQQPRLGGTSGWYRLHSGVNVLRFQSPCPFSPTVPTAAACHDHRGDPTAGVHGSGAGSSRVRLIGARAIEIDACAEVCSAHTTSGRALSRISSVQGRRSRESLNNAVVRHFVPFVCNTFFLCYGRFESQSCPRSADLLDFIAIVSAQDPAIGGQDQRGEFSE